MQLTSYTDYGLRVLIYLACADDGATVAEIADQYGISRNHLVKVVHRLSQLGYILTERGRFGGIRLANPPKDIRLGQVVRDLETTRAIVECFSPETNTCPIAPVCGLKGVLARAEAAFQQVLDEHTLADVIVDRSVLSAILLPAQE